MELFIEGYEYFLKRSEIGVRYSIYGIEYKFYYGWFKKKFLFNIAGGRC